MTAVRRALVALGVLAMAYAVIGAATGPDFRPVGHLTFLIAVLVAHDALVLPVAIGIGALAVRFVPTRVRGVVQAGLFASAVITLTELPFVLGRGRRPDNRSALPLNYPRGLLILLAVVWLVAIVIVVVRLRRDAAGHATGAPPDRTDREGDVSLG